MSLLQNDIVLRGVTYKVQELTGKHMAKVRELIASERWKVDGYVTMACCLDPKFSQADVDTLPQFVVDAISTEAFRLSKLDSPGNG